MGIYAPTANAPQLHKEPLIFLKSQWLRARLDGRRKK